MARGVFEQVGKAAALARSVPDAAAFAAAVARPAALNAPARSRLKHLRDLVTEALAGQAAIDSVGVDELAWRWLSALKVRVLRLEGAGTPDRTAAVATLQRSVADGTASAADGVFSGLCEASPARTRPGVVGSPRGDVASGTSALMR